MFDMAKRIVETVSIGTEPFEQDCAMAMAVEIIKADRLRSTDLAMHVMADSLNSATSVRSEVHYPEQKSPSWVQEELEN